jgi:hypothetical protein
VKPAFSTLLQLLLLTLALGLTLMSLSSGMRAFFQFCSYELAPAADAWMRRHSPRHVLRRPHLHNLAESGKPRIPGGKDDCASVHKKNIIIANSDSLTPKLVINPLPPQTLPLLPQPPPKLNPLNPLSIFHTSIPLHRERMRKPHNNSWGRANFCFLFSYLVFVLAFGIFKRCSMKHLCRLSRTKFHCSITKRIFIHTKQKILNALVEEISVYAW